MKKIIILIVALVIVITQLNTVYAKQIKNDYSKDLIIEHIDETSIDDNGFTINDSIDKFTDGYFLMRTTKHEDQEKGFTSSFKITGKNIKISYTKDGKLITQDYLDELAATSSCLYIQTDEMYVYLSQAQQIQKIDDDNRIYNNDCIPLTIKEIANGYIIIYNFKATKNAENSLWLITSKEPLIDLNDKMKAFIFKGYDLCENQFMTKDGYFFISNKSYSPYEENSFFKMVSPYVINSFIQTGGNKLANRLGQSFLNIQIKNINELGFVPMGVESAWLKSDYNIPKGYFDDRWNAEFALTLIVAYDKFKTPIYKEMATNLMNCFYNHIEGNFVSNYSEEGIRGILVSDYSHPNIKTFTHASFNHMIYLSKLLYSNYLINKDRRSKIYADRLIQGMENLGDRWIKANDDFYYAYLADGSMGLKDYPTLTYNDLVEIQKVLKKVRGYDSKIFAKLMEHKKKFMDDNGIKSYKK